MHRYLLFNKPYQVLSQFSREGDKKTLTDFLPGLAKNIYPVGRLDYDSEGLILLTDDKTITSKLLDPAHGHQRTYYVQVEGTITEEVIDQLATGVVIRIDGKTWTTRKALVRKLNDEPGVGERVPPIRKRLTVPTSWISMSLIEGKNRQVRRMTAAVGFPTLRLVRYAIGSITLNGIAPGNYRELNENEVQLLWRNNQPGNN